MKHQGFTLIELLVVISIIGLLASVVLIALNGARIKARDAKRIADIRQLQTALELYYNDNNNQYPALCSASVGYYAAGWSTILAPGYISKMPIDPLNVTAQYGYYYCGQYKPTGNCNFVSTGQLNNYMLVTRLENPSSSPNSCAVSFSGWDNGGLNYIVGSGQ